jgi:hypothetical protein
MSDDETEFDKLLREAREWDARDRSRHKAFDMDEDAADSFAARPRAPVVLDEQAKKGATDPGAGREPPRMEAPAKAASTIQAALKTAVSQAKAERAKARQATGRARPKGGGWGWIVWALVIAYFIFKRYLH